MLGGRTLLYFNMWVKYILDIHKLSLAISDQVWGEEVHPPKKSNYERKLSVEC